MARSPNPDFLNGVPELLILQLLARRPMHGYDVVRAIREQTASALAFGEGSIYPVLHRLERDGLLAADKEAVGGRPRIVYRLTPAGTARLTAAVGQWEAVVRAVRLVLDGGGTDAATEPA